MSDDHDIAEDVARYGWHAVAISDIRPMLAYTVLASSRDTRMVSTHVDYSLPPTVARPITGRRPLNTSLALALLVAMAGANPVHVAVAPATSDLPTAAGEVVVRDDAEVSELPDKDVIVSLESTGITDIGLKQLRQMGRLEVLKLHSYGHQVTDAGLVHLAGLRSLRDLELTGTSITDHGLTHLRKLDRLVFLNLDSSNGVTGKGLEALLNLQTLIVPNTAIDDDGLKAVGKLTRLRSLDLRDTRLTDAGLKWLAGLTEMVDLRLSGTPVTSAGLRHLHAMTKLRRLSLWGCNVDDAALVDVGRLKDLEQLSLSDTMVTDMGMRHLHGLRRLKKIWILRTRVTGTGVAALRLALPGVEVNPESAFGEGKDDALSRSTRETGLEHAVHVRRSLRTISPTAGPT